MPHALLWILGHSKYSERLKFSTKTLPLLPSAAQNSIKAHGLGKKGFMWSKMMYHNDIHTFSTAKKFENVYCKATWHDYGEKSNHPMIQVYSMSSL